MLIFTEPVHNEDFCKSSYLVDLSEKKGPQAAARQICPLDDIIEVRRDSAIFVTSQNLLLLEGKLHRFISNWSMSRNIYSNLATASLTLGGFPILMELPPIKQGYLACVLRMHRSGLNVAPLYNLDKEWERLLELHYAFKSGTANLHISLIRFNLLSYYDATGHMIKSLITGNWENVRRILKYYGNRSPYMNYKDIQTAITKLNIVLPPELASLKKK
jgi:hypothetical protein